MWIRLDQYVPPDGTWCWVKTKQGEVFPAKRNERATGRWSNEDTWEDFTWDVVAFIPIVEPRP